MGLASDLRILYHLALKPVRGKDHATRMENFYAGQAGAYDDFRKRLLKGRQELWNLIPPPPGGTWLDMGGGTGANLEYFATCPTPDSRLPTLSPSKNTAPKSRTSPSPVSRTTSSSAANLAE